MSHVSSVTELHSEQAYDALMGAMSIAGRLIESPCTRNELAEAFPNIPPAQLDRHLRRLIRSGLARMEDGTYEATSQVLYSHRQGALMNLVSELFLPALMSLTLDSEQGLLLSLHLNLSEVTQEKLFENEVRGLFQKLSDLADEPAPETHERFVMVIGTPNPPKELEGIDSALDILRSAANERANPETRARAILSYSHARFGSPERAAKLILRFEQDFDPFKTKRQDANYQLLLGFGHRLPSNGEQI